jgi:L-aminopeptidase/D-esterase-like protein
VNTPFDGDLVFAVSTAEREEELPSEELLGLGVAARTLLEEAIRRAVTAGGPNP